jgi:hypothetical protein
MVFRISETTMRMTVTLFVGNPVIETMKKAMGVYSKRQDRLNP